MIKIDIIGDFQEKLDAILEGEDFDLFLIDQITCAEDFQDVLVIYPPAKKKFRWKGYTEEDAEILYDYVEKGGILVLIPPSNREYLEKTILIYEIFRVSPVFCQENILLHINPHIINNGEIGKRPMKKYFHFLTQEKEEMETIIEGNWIPVFAFKLVGKGVVILYGLGSKNFWDEDLLSIFKYLQKDFASFWEKSQLTETQLENALQHAHKKYHSKIRDAFIHVFGTKKRFKEFLEIKDEELKNELLQNLQLNIIEKEFENLSGKFLVKKYRELYRSLNKEYPDLIKKVQHFLYQKIQDQTINEKTFNKLYEDDMLPSQAAHLVIFYLDPKDKNPENYKKFKENLSKLIQWNKQEQIFDEDYLKNLAWEHL